MGLKTGCDFRALGGRAGAGRGPRRARSVEGPGALALSGPSPALICLERGCTSFFLVGEVNGKESLSA